MLFQIFLKFPSTKITIYKAEGRKKLSIYDNDKKERFIVNLGLLRRVSELSCLQYIKKEMFLKAL